MNLHRLFLSAVLTSCACLAGGLATGALADAIVWDNGGPAGNGGAYSSQRPLNSQVADDFMLPRNLEGDPQLPTLITDVHWTGVWFNPGPPGNATAFNIYFYNDAGGVPTGGPDDPVPTAFASFIIPIAACNETDIGGGYFSYDVVLPTGVQVEKERLYWIGIQSESTFPPQWGWAQSDLQQLNGAVQGAPYWGHLGNNPDMSYYLTGVKIPEPASIALLALGALALCRRR